MTEIRQQFAGTKVASRKASSFTLQTLQDLTSFLLLHSWVRSQRVLILLQSVTEFENQLESGNVSVLVYNEQTVTPLTQQMKQIAVQYNVTVVGVTETIQPPDVTFQDLDECGIDEPTECAQRESAWAMSEATIHRVAKRQPRNPK